MIRFIFQHDLDPKALHREFLRAGARPSMYSYKPSLDMWTLCIADPVESNIVDDVLRRLKISFTIKEVPSRFSA
jgi:hypothetical protein